MHRLDKDATVYHYTLVKRIRHRPLPLLLYGILPIPAALLLAISGSVRSPIWVAAGVVLFPLVYSAVTRLYIGVLQPERGGAWTMTWHPPWLGLMPVQHYPLRSMLRLHHHLLWIGAALAGLLYPWVSPESLSILLGVHLWYMAPRYWIFARLNRSGQPPLLKISRTDSSCYLD